MGETLHALASLAHFQRRYFRASLGESHPVYTLGLVCEATALLRSGDAPVKAEELLRMALAILQAALPADHGDISAAEGKLGFALYQQSRMEEAAAGGAPGPRLPTCGPLRATIVAGPRAHGP